MAYVYDDLDRLISSERADDYDQSWTLDGMGNWSEFDDDGDSQTRDSNKANEITDITGGWVTPEYDRAGNMIFAPKSGDETTGLHFVRDAWNRQVAVYEDDGDGVFEPTTDDTPIGEYEFDGLNRRIEKELSATHAHYYYNNAWQLLEERFVDGQGDPIEINQHVFSARYIDSPIVWLHDGNGDGDLEDVGDLIRYYLSDANHNTTAVFDSATGAVVNRYVYAAYGSHVVYDPDWTNPTAPTADGLMYCGYWHDIETGNYQVRAREYITCLSTFDVRDPIGYGAGDMNLYRYCGGNPLARTDPSGMVVEEPTALLTGGFTECAFGAFDGRDPDGYDVTLPNDAVVHVEQYGILIIHPDWCIYCGDYLVSYDLYDPDGSPDKWTYHTYVHFHSPPPDYSPGPSGRDWYDSFSNSTSWYHSWFSGWLGDNLRPMLSWIYGGNDAFANADPTLLFGGTIIASIPLGFGIFVAGEAALGVGTFELLAPMVFVTPYIVYVEGTAAATALAMKYPGIFIAIRELVTPGFGTSIPGAISNIGQEIFEEITED